MLIEHNINMLSNLLVDDSLNDMDSESEFPENVGGRLPYVKTLHLLHGRTPFWHILWYLPHTTALPDGVATRSYTANTLGGLKQNQVDSSLRES